ncbi:Mss4-like protein [Exophiala viscosa]|uniref:Mss4-like protein n=1 Tax=Exophiala viscosa TaxID=2486360 RepID=A0AAN6DS83_9EURO|nr:Mss4-like protein [Exophiala viscosa]
MPTGSCFCGNLKIEYSGEPAMTVLCHCADCRHISGGLYSYNVVVPSSEFKVTSGTPKEISKTADSGKSITSNFCPECGTQSSSPYPSTIIDRATNRLSKGTTLFRYGDSFGGKDGMRIIKAGVLDDVSVVNSAKPTGELYSNERIQWVEPVQGADQTKGMGS